MPNKTQVSIAFPGQHDHAACIRDAVSSAARICERRKVRLTPIRRRVLELVWQSHRPALAYELLTRLREEKPNATPATVYRALDFLLAQKLVHKLETLNAYLGCGNPGGGHPAQFMICSRCGAAAEIDTRPALRQLEATAAALEFTITSPTIELLGYCAACRKDEND
ncbi:MAG: Fur family transcriptional regulator [Pseudomonadota bacterium]|nr:Fur family transcriptional regulator [Pseudomonadota bacterium]